MTQPSPQLPTRTGVPTPSASPRPSVSRSVTPTATHSTAAAAAQQENTVAAPVTSSAPAVISAPPTVPAPAGNWLLNQTSAIPPPTPPGGHDLRRRTDGGPACSTARTARSTPTARALHRFRRELHRIGLGGHDRPARQRQYDETAVSQDGGVNSGFYLQYTEPADRWAFSRAAGDTDNPSVYRALSASAPALSTWTHLVGSTTPPTTPSTSM